jgi:2,3-bisphosphoglycerate-independent phosphoglycerate mutase
VFDGLGFNRDIARAVIAGAWKRLPHGAADQLLATARRAPFRPAGADVEQLAKLSMYPVCAEALAADTPFDDAVATLSSIRFVRERAARVRPDIDESVSTTARERRYVPWCASMPILNALRNEGVSWPTSAAGIWAGFEDLTPPVQGNSDTGHQQIGNLTVAPQTPLEITRAIEDGSFFRNEALNSAIDSAKHRGGAVNFCFLLSGTVGGDGRVHSAWNHLEAFLRLVFEVHHLPPARVRMQAILDGRDCPPRSSITADGGTGDYLGRLQTSLGRYGAEESLAWVVGRNIAMDRDYREPNPRADYRLLTAAEGRWVDGFAGVRAAVEEAHAAGKTDSDVPPLVVLDTSGKPRRVSTGETFVDLQFRADRQRAKVASLLGDQEFLASTARAHGKAWDLDWLDDSLRSTVCTLAEYHPRFEDMGARVAFANRPQPDNFLALFPDLFPGERYLLAGESVKSAHVGFFVRGRREAATRPGIEDRVIVPSCGAAVGVTNDSDFFKTPGMRSREIAEVLRSRLDAGYRLIIANFSNCDMIGHLLPARFEPAIQACEALDGALRTVVPAARSAGYDVVLTSDHGNVEDDTTAHTTNDVLTTVLPAAGTPAPEPEVRQTYQARLFDIPWTLGRLLGVEEAVRSHVSRSSGTLDERFLGRPLVRAAG